jgi:FK506-binding protein 3
MGIMEETEAKLAALRLRLPELEGKANKKERTAVSKEIYSLENDEAYCAAVKANLEGSRAQAAAADDEAHQAKLKAEAAEDEARRAAAEARAAAGPAEPEADEDEESHLEILERLIKGDGKTTPAAGDYVYCTYTGKFADGTEHGGVDYSGKMFDTTWDGKAKKHRPLHFQHCGGKAIRGWDEALKTMSLGEKVSISIGPKWAYRKAGISDDKGQYVVPPNATLEFEMQLVGVKDVKRQDDSISWNAR